MQDTFGLFATLCSDLTRQSLSSAAPLGYSWLESDDTHKLSCGQVGGLVSAGIGSLDSVKWEESLLGGGPTFGSCLDINQIWKTHLAIWTARAAT